MTKERKIFLTRLTLFVLIGLVIPATYLCVKFKLFQTTEKKAVGGWGVVFIVFCAIFLVTFINEIRKGLAMGLSKQICNGLARVTIPLLSAIFIIYWMDNLIDDLLQFLIIVCICETLAYPINPIPQWAYENGIEMQAFSFKKFISMINGKDKDEKD